MSNYSKLSIDLMRNFYSDIEAPEFFSYVGNMVTIEQAISVIGILQPDFVERDNCVFWCPNAQEYDPSKHKMVGLVEDGDGELIISNKNSDVERYRNNFSISQLFKKWENNDSKLLVSENRRW